MKPQSENVFKQDSIFSLIRTIFKSSPKERKNHFLLHWKRSQRLNEFAVKFLCEAYSFPYLF